MARPPRHEPGVRPQTVFPRRLCLGRVCVGQLLAVLTATPAPVGKDPAAFINPTRRWEKDGRGESGCEETGPRTERCPPPGLPSVCSPPGSRVFHTGAAERSRQTRPPLPEGSSATGSARGGRDGGALEPFRWSSFRPWPRVKPPSAVRSHARRPSCLRLCPRLVRQTFGGRRRHKAPAAAGFISKTRGTVTLAFVHFPGSGVTGAWPPPDTARRAEAGDAPLS